jgi:hypothetical protein
MTEITENKAEMPLQQEKTEAKTEEKQSEQKQVTTEESEKDRNWRAFREKSKNDRLELEAANRKAAEKEAEVLALTAAMEAAFNKKSTNSTQISNNQYGNDDEETEDQRIEKKVQAAIIARDQENERFRYERELKEFPQRLQKDFPDFNQTISDENQDYLIYHYPEVANILKKLPEGYDKWQDIYKAIKKFVPNNTTAKKEAAKAEANFNKPKSMSSTGVTQPGEARSSAVISEEKKAENWARMQKTLKGVG